MPAKKIIVVGGNAAGPAAAAKAKRVNPDAEVVLYEASPYISTGTCELPYVLSGHIKDYKKIVFFDSESFYDKKGVKVFTKHFVKAIDKKNKTVLVENTSTKQMIIKNYDSLILTTGTKLLPIQEIPTYAENVFSLKTISNLLKIQKYIGSNFIRNILIIGGSYIGLEAAEAFYELGYNITILEKASFPMPSAEVEIQHLLFSELEKNKIRFFANVDTEFIMQGNKIQTVKINGRFLEFDLVLTATGFVPNNSLAIAAGLKVGNYSGLVVDKKQKTSDPNIYAAGDNTEIINFVTDKPDYIPTATFAQKQGHVAGGNAAGANKFVQPFVKNIAVKIFNNSYVSVGITEKEANLFGFTCSSVFAVAPNLVKIIPESRKVFGKIIFDKNTKKILGASFLGGAEVVGFGDLISSLILQKTNAEILADISYNYTPPLSPFINILSILGRKIKEV